MWVHPLFKKKIKKEAVDNDIPILQLTKEIAKNEEKLFKKKKKDEKDFMF